MSEAKISKEIIEREYDLAITDYDLARNREEQWDARKVMSRLEEVAAKLYGSCYADELALKKESIYT